MKHNKPAAAPMAPNTRPQTPPPQNPEDAKQKRHAEKALRREKRKARRWRHICAILIIILALIIIGLLVCMLCDFNPFTGQKGSGAWGNVENVLSGGTKPTQTVERLYEGEQSTPVPTATDVPTKQNTDSENNSQNILITIVENDIYFDGKLCNDLDDLQDRIIDTYMDKPLYVLDSKLAILRTYDEVNQLLHNLENALGIKYAEK